MNEMIQIQGTNILLKEYQGKRVVTFKDVDLVHKRPEGTAKRNFNQNRIHFVNGADFYCVTKKEVGTNFVQTYGFENTAPSGLLLTETGYLMLVKSFNDELAWKVQRELVDSYFNKKELHKPEEPQSEQPAPIEHDPSIYIQAAQIAAGLPGGHIYSINCLRHIVPDIDVEPVQEEVTVKEEVKTTVKTTQRGNPKFFKVGVPCDTVKLRKTMNQKNLSISRMARLSEVSTTTVKNILDGKHNPTVETRTKFCKALKVSEDYLTPVTEAK